MGLFSLKCKSCERLRSEVDEARWGFARILTKYNDLVDIINGKGGQEFLDGPGVDERTNSQFTDKELKILQGLCHPDKHQGADRATEITRKILSLRGK